MVLVDVFLIISVGTITIGVSTCIVWQLFRMMSDRIAERLRAKYELEISKELKNYEYQHNKELEKIRADFAEELENHKSRLYNKNYVSKVRFDKEFEVFEKLMGAFFSLRIEMSENTGLVYSYNDEKENIQALERNYTEWNDANFLAQNKLNENAAFISKDFYDKFHVLLQMYRELHLILRSKIVYEKTKSAVNRELYEEALKRQGELIQQSKTKHDELTDEIRSHLEKLEAGYKGE